MICPSCGFDNPPGFHFCGACGSPLEQRTTSRIFRPVDSGVFPRGEAERRQITVMFSDVVGSTALSERLDPEELRELIQAYQDAAATAIERFEGYIAQYLGDGILAYFGYPVAHEDDAERAVRAALDLVSRIERLNKRVAGENASIAIRVGIHTGLVVVGEVGGGHRREQLALGRTPNMAARLQGVAEPNEVVVSETTRRLVDRVFLCDPVGEHELEGLAGMQTVYRVREERELTTMLDEGPASRPLVGREEELERLHFHWTRATKGQGSIICVCGEAGIGKSHLLRTFRQNVESDRGSLRLIARCSSYHRSSSYHPIVELLGNVLNFYPEQADDDRLEMLELVVEKNNLPAAESVPLLASLLSVPIDGKFSAPSYGAQVQSEKTREALVRLFEKLAADATMLFVVEDVHWADPSTVEFLRMLAAKVPGRRVMAVLTHRPEFSPPWKGQEGTETITLGRLGLPESKQIVDRVASERTLPDEILHQVLAKTDGIPLFVEELTKMVLESGMLEEADTHLHLSGILPPLAIPTTLQDSLMARLDRLSAVKELAQLGSAIGRTFHYPLLKAVARTKDGVLQDALQKLVDAEFLYQKGTPPDSTYIFKHALIQDVAYNSLLKSTRQRFHQRIASTLEKDFPDLVKNEPELLAHHYTEAGLSKNAIGYWQIAATRALTRSANEECIEQARKGLSVLKTADDIPDAKERELALLLALGPALIAQRGYAYDMVEQVYRRARGLCNKVGNTEHRFQALLGLFAFYFVRLELPTALELAEELLEFAQETQDRAALVGAHTALGITIYWFGRLNETIDHLQEAVDLYDPLEHRELAFRFGQDNAVVSLCYTAMAKWLIGMPDSALKLAHAAVALAESIEHPHSLAFALNFDGWIHQLRGERKEVRRVIDRQIHLCSEHGFEHWLANGLMMEAWLLADENRFEEAVTRMDSASVTLRHLGVAQLTPFLADIQGRMGRPEVGIRLVERDMSTLSSVHDHVWLPEWSRQKGVLLLTRRGDGDEILAEQAFLTAIEGARRHGTKAWELKATTELAALYRSRGDAVRAIEVLKPVADQFSEGGTTQDVVRARSLLAEMMSAE